MPTYVCKNCGKPFETQSGLKRVYCRGDCFRAMEAVETAKRRATWSDARKSASNLVWSARWRGELKKQSCEVCSDPITVAHHDDYARPLDVRWLCRSHHLRWHHKNGKGANA